MFRKLIFAVACSVLVVGAPAVQAACTTGFALFDIKTGATLANTLTSFVSVVSPGFASVPATGCGGWKRGTLKIVIPGGSNACTQANIAVVYEGTPKGWSVNLGDSSTNDGFGGDAGTTNHDAELWILEEDLSLTQADTLAGPLLAGQHLALTDSSLKFVVKNQFVSWGQPYSVVQQPVSQTIFAIPDTTVPAADQRAIYLGLNQVITGRSDRTGCGARFALITFQ